MGNRKRIGSIVFDSCNATLMVVLMIATLYPILHVAFASVSEPALLARHQGALFSPLGFTMEGYRLVLRQPTVVTGYKNTLIYVGLGTALNVLLTSMAAYVLSRKNLFWGGPLMFLIVFTMFFSGGLIPFFLTVRDLGLLDRRAAMIIPTAVAAWNIILMRTSFREIPDSMEESARIDGATDFTILFRIILPLSLPVIAAMTLFYAVARWNEWFNAVIFFRRRELYPLQVFLRELLILNSDDAAQNGFLPMDDEKYKQLVKYCTIMVATVPILLIYPFLQKYFVKGVMIGAIKG